MKKCRCGVEYIQYTTLQTRCPKCLADKAQKRREKTDRKETKDARDRLKTRGDHAKEAQTAFNRWIRARDVADSCISCGREHRGQYHAGHYRTVGSSPELRYSLLNCHKQCAPCNNQLSGNIVEYRIRLREKIGEDNVEWLEGPHSAKKYTIDELKEIKKGFNAWARELEKAQL